MLFTEVAMWVEPGWLVAGVTSMASTTTLVTVVEMSPDSALVGAPSSAVVGSAVGLVDPVETAPLMVIGVVELEGVVMRVLLYWVVEAVGRSVESAVGK